MRRRFKVTGTTTAVSIAGDQYQADMSGIIEVDEIHAAELLATGIVVEAGGDEATRPQVNDATKRKPKTEEKP